MMTQPANYLLDAIVSSSKLACCHSLCDILTELPLPSALVDKSPHTRTLISDGLNGDTTILNDLSLMPHLQQVLYLAKQTVAEINFVTNPSPSTIPLGPNTVSPLNSTGNANAQQPPSRLLLALSSKDFFCNSPKSPSMYQQQHQQPPPHPSLPNKNNSDTSAATVVNLSNLKATLQTIEPSIDKHMTDDLQNQNELMNDDGDMSSQVPINAFPSSLPPPQPHHQQTANSMFNLQPSQNGNNIHSHEVQSTIPNHKPVKLKQIRSSSDDDKDWEPPFKKFKSHLSPYPKAPAIRSVKYSFCDTDYSNSTMVRHSSVDIVVRFEQIIDKILSTSCDDDFNDDYEEEEDSDSDEQEVSLKKKKQHVKSRDASQISFNVTIDAEQLKEIMLLSGKLKQNNRVVEIERKKIIHFLAALSNQLNIWFTRYKSSKASADDDEQEDDTEEEREHFWELCCNASQSALHIMTASSPDNDTASLISLEELIEAIVDFLSNNLSSTTHVSNTATNARSPKGKANRGVHFGVSKRHVTRWTQLLQLLFEFINLRSKGSLTDSLILSLTRISMNALFLLQNTAEMQFVSIEVMCHIFEQYQQHRIAILEELLSSLGKIPIKKKSHRKDTVLTQLLVRLTNAFFQSNTDVAPGKDTANTLQHTSDSLTEQNTSASQVITGFMAHFIRKCTSQSSSNNSEVDFKLIFEALLNDLLESLYSPQSTACILIVQIITKLLISTLKPNQGKTLTQSARNFALDYLSVICSKYAQILANKEDTAEEVEMTLSTIEESGKFNTTATTTKKSRQKDKEKEKKNNKDPQVVFNKVWNLLVDYFNSEKLYREKLVLASIWIKDVFFVDNELGVGPFLQRLNTAKPQDDVDISVVDASTAALCIQYMEFVHLSTNVRLFEYAIMHVTASLGIIGNPTQRSKAMRCLSNILSSSSIERAAQLLARSDLQGALQTALLDPSASVREATVDLIGRYVLQSKDQTLCQRYCNLIGARILDTGISVRKRVIKILRDFCIEFPEFEQCGEIAGKIVCRINDEGEGIRRLVVETCRELWFSKTTASQVKFKVHSLLQVIAAMINDQASIEAMQSLFDQLIKADTVSIAQQICDCIMSDILIDNLTHPNKLTQLSAIQCVAMLAQSSPQLLVKHCDTLQSFLSLPCETLNEISLRKCVIQTIERVLPHINSPSHQLLARIEADLTRNIFQSVAAVLQCSVKCLSILIRKHTKNTRLAGVLFNKFEQLLSQYRGLLREGQLEEEQVKPKLLRAIYTCGLFAKYFSEDIAEYKDRVRDTLFELIQSPYSVEIKCNSIIALGFVIESDPQICLHPTVVEIYTSILRNQFSNDASLEANRKNDEMFCIQVLNNFRNYLSESIESGENAVKTIEWSRESLKSMQSAEDDSSSAQSKIIQKYLSSILINALNPNLSIRRVACNVIHVIHSGGHVYPLQLVPHLVAMTSDDDQQIRMRADHVLHEIERKYHGFISMKAKEAIYLSAIFCKRLNCPGYRVYVEKSTGVNSTDGLHSSLTICSRLSTLYQVVCTNRQSRRGFIASLLHHLDSTDVKQSPSVGEDVSESTAPSDAREVIEMTHFVVENVLFFPYTVMDEILYILDQLECTSSINSAYIIQLFKELFIEQPASTSEEEEEEEEQATNENVLEGLEDIDFDNNEEQKPQKCHIHLNADLLLSDTGNERLTNLVRSLRTIYLSTLLRTVLKELYLLKDEKINDYSTNDAKTWEKPVHRRQIDSTLLKELFTTVKPCLAFPESQLLREDFSGIEKQLLDEWKRFKYVSLNNCDPNFKSTLLRKLFRSPNGGSVKELDDSLVQVNGHNAQISRVTPKKSKSIKKPAQKKQKKKRRRIVVRDDSESPSDYEDDDDDEDYNGYD